MMDIYKLLILICGIIVGISAIINMFRNVSDEVKAWCFISFIWIVNCIMQMFIV